MILIILFILNLVIKMSENTLLNECRACKMKFENSQ